ncbi:MAG: DegV family protein [Mycoplasmatales bacterium]
MNKTAILIDSTFIIEEEYVKANNIYIAPLTINFENTTFKEIGDLEAITTEVFTKIDKEKVIPKTSQPSVQEFLDLYNQIIKDGYTNILAFHLTSKLSGTYQGSVNAANTIKEQNSEIVINVFDTLNVAVSSIVLKEIINELNIIGEISNERINKYLTYYSKSCKILLSVDNLEYLALGGRIKPAVAAIGNLFGIKPLLQIKEGEILEFAKVRSQKKAFKRMIEEFENDVLKNQTETYLIGATHVLDEKSAKKLLTLMIKILEKNDIKYEKAIFAPLSPVIGNHTGPNSIGIAWIKKSNV